MYSTEYSLYFKMTETDRHNLSICTKSSEIISSVRFISSGYYRDFFCSKSRLVSFRLEAKDSGKDVLE